MDLLDLYAAGSEWTIGKVAGADDLSAATPCDRWDLCTLLSHMLETQRYFVSSARGQDVPPPGPDPQATLGPDPVADFQRARQEVLATFGEPGSIDRTGPALGIAFTDLLIHGWDVARATGQDAAMPDNLAEAAYGLVHGKFSDEQRSGLFKPEMTVAEDADPQDRLLAYTGRDPG